MPVDFGHFLDDFEVLSRVGWVEGFGTDRLALGENDIRIRRELIARLSAIGARIKFDDAGNIIAEIGDPSKPAIAIGSHLDSVLGGGRFDGAYGVIAGLEVLRGLRDEVKNHRLMLIDFTNEEGARWIPSLLGSGLTTGVFTRDFVYSRVDKDGITFGDALRASGFMGEEPNRLMHDPPRYYLELHIEQGPVLEREGYQIGIPLGIVNIRVLEIKFAGEANQAGPTPMALRRDAVLAMARFIEFIRDYALIRDSNERLRATVGIINVKPGIYNVIPSEVSFTLDIRSPYEDEVNKAVTYVIDVGRAIAEDLGVGFEHRDLFMHGKVEFDREVIRTIEDTCRDLGLRYRFMWSWAGHDAQYMARISRVGMIFVPSVNGRSHTKEEFTKNEDLINGLKVLAETVRRLDGHEGRES